MVAKSRLVSGFAFETKRSAAQVLKKPHSLFTLLLPRRVVSRTTAVCLLCCPQAQAAIRCMGKAVAVVPPAGAGAGGGGGVC